MGKKTPKNIQFSTTACQKTCPTPPQTQGLVSESGKLLSLLDSMKILHHDIGFLMIFSQFRVKPGMPRKLYSQCNSVA